MRMTKEINQLLAQPTRRNWEIACMLLNLLKDDSWSNPRLAEEIDRCTAIMRTWYRSRAKDGGPTWMRRAYGPETPCYAAHRRRTIVRKITPSHGKVLPMPLPGRDCAEYQDFMTALSTAPLCKAAFAYAPRHRRHQSWVLVHNVTYRGGSILGMALRDAYRRNAIDRKLWAVEHTDWEHDLIEDMVFFQIARWPGMPTKSVLRLNRSVSALLTSMPPGITQIALQIALMRLRDAGRIVDPRPNRWCVSHSGDEASGQLFYAWLGMTVGAPYGEEEYTIRGTDLPS
jgi:hypothetical protein